MTDAVPLARALARFIDALGPSTIPPEVEAKARACLLNGYGIALGCHATEFAPVARAAAIAMEANRPMARRCGVTGAAPASPARRSPMPRCPTGARRKTPAARRISVPS